MKIEHKVRYREVSHNMTGKLDPDYEREVEEATTKLEVAYAKAERRVEAAKKRMEKAARKMETLKVKKARVVATKEHGIALAEYEDRLRELEEIRQLMTSSPAGSQHRGTKSFRPVPLT